MENVIDFLSKLFPICMPVLWSIFIIVKWPEFWSFVKALFSDKGDVSSRRFIAIMSALCLLYLCIYAQVHAQTVEPWVLTTLLILTFVSTGWATIPEVIKLVGAVKNMIPSGNEPEKQSVREVSLKQTELNITDKTD